MNSKYYDRAEVILEARCIYNDTTKKCELFILNNHHE